MYNLHTENNLFTVNSISENKGQVNDKGVIVHNCRCTMVVEFEGLEKSASEKKLDEAIKNQSYKQWGESRWG